MEMGWDLGGYLEYDCGSTLFTIRHSRSFHTIATSIPLSVFGCGSAVSARPTSAARKSPFRRAQFEELEMYLYENVIRNHELRVAKSLERYDLREGKDAGRVHVYPLFARARRAVRRR